MFVYLSDLFGCRRYGAVQDELAIATDTPIPISVEPKVSEVAQRALLADLSSVHIYDRPDGVNRKLMLLTQAMQVGAVEKVRELIKDPGFLVYMNRGYFGESFSCAAKAGRLAVIQEIMKDDRLVDMVNKSGVSGFPIAMIGAVNCDHLSVALELMKGSWFKDIQAEGAYGLGEIFGSAAGKGSLTLVKKLMAHPRFKDISYNRGESIERAMGKAAYAGHLHVVKEIMRGDWTKEKHVDEGYCFESVLIWAAEGGHLNIIKEMLKDDHVFQKIYPTKLKNVKQTILDVQAKSLIDRYVGHLKQIRQVVPIVVFQRALRHHLLKKDIGDFSGIIGNYLGV